MLLIHIGFKSREPRIPGAPFLSFLRPLSRWKHCCFPASSHQFGVVDFGLSAVIEQVEGFDVICMDTR
jgi:hypothetical protein